MTRLIALIPAYNEESTIGACLTALFGQTRPADRVIVVADNCTDSTAAVAVAAGADVIETVGNQDRKAGALNQALTILDSALGDDDAVLVMDADTTLAGDFAEVALAHLVPGVGGVGGVFTGHPSPSMLGQLQRMEYHRYSREPARHGGRAHVLTGTGAVFAVRALRQVADARRDGVRLPAGDGVYDTHSLTEDNELTLALRTLGWQAVAPGVQTTTDVMETDAALWHQRKRWYLGAQRNLTAYGRRLPWHMRWVYWRQQAGLLLASLTLVAYLAALTATAVSGRLGFNAVWLLPTVVLLVERTWSVWPMGWCARLLAALVVPEQVYTAVLTVVHIAATASFVSGRKGEWRAT